MRKLISEAKSTYESKGLLPTLKKGQQYIVIKTNSSKDNIKHNIYEMIGKRKYNIGEFSAKFIVESRESAKATNWRISTEKEQLEDLLNELRKEEVFFDIGANTGLYTLFAKNKTNHVIAFEPYPPNVTELQKNVELNGGGVKIIKKALSNENKSDTFSVPEKNIPGHGHATFSSKKKSGNLEIEAVKGDELIQCEKIPQPNIVKIDVEGSEPHVLEGLKKALKNEECRVLYCEVHLPTDHRPSINDFGYSVPKLWRLIESYGFEIEKIWGRGSPDFHIKAKKKADRILDGGYTFFGSPRAFQSNGRIFVGSISSLGDIQISLISEREHIETKVLEENFNSDAFETDDHASPQVFVRNDGHILAFWDRKIEQIRYKISEFPNNITSFSDVRVIETGGADYASPVQLPNGKMMLFYRGPEVSNHSFYESGDGGETWTDRGCFIEADENRAVYTANYQNGKIIHFVVSNHPRNDGTKRAFDEPHNIWYVKYDSEKEVWQNAAGKCLAESSELPLNLTNDLDVVYNSASNDAEAWLWDILVDENTPKILFATFPDPTDHRYQYAEWSGRKWEVTEITKAGNSLITNANQPEDEYSGGICFDRNDPNSVYASVERQGKYKVKKFTRNERKVWEKKETIGTGFRPEFISNSDKKANPKIIYMNGYYRFFEKFNTDILWG